MKINLKELKPKISHCFNVIAYNAITVDINLRRQLLTPQVFIW